MNLNQPNYQQQFEKVQFIADRLEIPLTVIDLRKQFEKTVLTYFSSSYQQGLTPNPCIICNQTIKFGLFLQAIQRFSPDKIATGHYAKISSHDGFFHLYNGKDPYKNQSYFLSRLSQQQLSHVLFPLGSLLKSDVYSLVKAAGFDDFEGQESQDVCFLENGKVGDLLESRFLLSTKPGEIVNLENKCLGKHRGVHHYTIGQRKGLGISDATPYYVVALDVELNRVVVGKADDLLKTQIIVTDIHWIIDSEPDLDQDYLVRIRHTHSGAMARVYKLENDHYSIIFKSPQRAITPGQFAVLYSENEVIGSGVIQ